MARKERVLETVLEAVASITVVLVSREELGELVKLKRNVTSMKGQASYRIHKLARGPRLVVMFDAKREGDKCRDYKKGFKVEKKITEIYQLNPCGESDQLVVHLNLAKNG